MGVNLLGPDCLDLCVPHVNLLIFNIKLLKLYNFFKKDENSLWGKKRFTKEHINCFSKWDQIMHCHQSGLRARKIQKIRP